MIVDPFIETKSLPIVNLYNIKAVIHCKGQRVQSLVYHAESKKIFTLIKCRNLKIKINVYIFFRLSSYLSYIRKKKKIGKEIH